MFKNFKWQICSILIVILMLMLCGCNNRITVTDYTSHEVSGLSFELPEQWRLEKDSEKDYSVDFDDSKSTFTIGVKELGDSYTDELFDDFADRHMHDVIVSVGGTNIKCTSTIYNTYEAYDYTAEATVEGKTANIKITVFYVGNNAISAMLIYTDDLYEYDTVYEHFLSSIN